MVVNRDWRIVAVFAAAVMVTLTSTAWAGPSRNYPADRPAAAQRVRHAVGADSRALTALGITVARPTAPRASAPIPVTPAQMVFHAGGAVILSSATIRQYCQDAAAAAGLGPQGWAYLYSICEVESSLGQDLSTSPAGAEGPMQFLPSTWAEYGAGSVFDLRDSIMAAARMLRANGAPQDWPAAVYQYNHSRDYVREVVAGEHKLLAGQ